MKIRPMHLLLVLAILTFGIYTRPAHAVVAFDTAGDNVAWWVPHCFGLEFTANAPVTLTHLGVFDYMGDGLHRDIQLALYDYNSQTLLSQVVVPMGTGTQLIDNYRYAALADPLSLAAGGRYMVVGVLNSYLLYPPTTFTENSSAVSISNWTHISNGGSMTLQFPALHVLESSNDYSHGMNMNFQFTESPAASPVPEPASMALMLSGLAGMGGMALRKKNTRK